MSRVHWLKIWTINSYPLQLMGHLQLRRCLNVVRAHDVYYSFESYIVKRSLLDRSPIGSYVDLKKKRNNNNNNNSEATLSWGGWMCRWATVHWRYRFPQDRQKRNHKYLSQQKCDESKMAILPLGSLKLPCCPLTLVHSSHLTLLENIGKVSKKLDT